MICWIESVDPFADLCLTNQIYSVLLNAFQFKEITEVQNAHFKMLLEDRETQTRRCKTFMLRNAATRWRSWKVTSFVASTRHHRARLLKYYPRQPCVPGFVKSRMLRPLQTHFLLFQQIFFILVCIHAGNLGCLFGFWPRCQNPAGAKISTNLQINLYIFSIFTRGLLGCLLGLVLASG